MSILYCQEIQNKKIVANYHTDVGRKLKQENPNKLNNLLYILKESIDLLARPQNNLYKYFKEDFYFYIYFDEKVLGFISDTSCDENKLNIVINHILNKQDVNIPQILSDFNNDNLIDDIADEITQTKQICSQSLNLILNRGEKIDQLNILSDELGEKVKKFKKDSEKLLGSRVADMFIGLGVIIFIFFVYYYFVR